jgi:hypothetical protein
LSVFINLPLYGVTEMHKAKAKRANLLSKPDREYEKKKK